MENVISVKNVSYDYKTDDGVSRGVKNISLDIERGAFVVFLGHNGSGKSTLAKLLNGFLVPDEGDVTVNGINTRDDEQTYEIRSKVGMVFQNPDNQMVASIIEDDLAFGPENLGVEPAEIRRRVDWALKTVNMTEYKDRTPSKLSGGQKQRVAIAAILSMMPEVLILDESTAMLDPKGRAEVLETASKLNKEEGMTIILITHYMDEAVNADDVVVLKEGEIIANGKPKEIFGKPELIKRASLELPVAARVAQNLIDLGFNLSPALTDEELVEELCALK